MEKATFTYPDFEEFVLNEAKKIIPNISFIERLDDRTHIIKTDDGHSFHLNLSNVWKNYQQNTDINIIFEHLEGMLSAFSDFENDEFDLNGLSDRIFPAVRHKEFGIEGMTDDLDEKQLNDAGIIGEKMMGDLKLVFLIDHEKYTAFITKAQADKFLPYEDIKTIGINNLKKQGWVEHIETIHTKTGKIYIFDNGMKTYNFQFFIKDWAETLLDDEFYFSFPSRNMTFVFIPNKKRNTKQFLAERAALVSMTIEHFSESGHSISPHLYVYRNKEYSCVTQ